MKPAKKAICQRIGQRFKIRAPGDCRGGPDATSSLKSARPAGGSIRVGPTLKGRRPKPPPLASSSNLHPLELIYRGGQQRVLTEQVCVGTRNGEPTGPATSGSLLRNGWALEASCRYSSRAGNPLTPRNLVVQHRPPTTGGCPGSLIVRFRHLLSCQDAAKALAASHGTWMLCVREPLI